MLMLTNVTNVLTIGMGPHGQSLVHPRVLVSPGRAKVPKRVMARVGASAPGERPSLVNRPLTSTHVLM